MDEPVGPTVGRGEVSQGGAVFVVLAQLGGDLVAGWAGDALVLGQLHADHATTARPLPASFHRLRGRRVRWITAGDFGHLWPCGHVAVTVAAPGGSCVCP